MRILPFGDSVVLGEGASGGFRAPLEELLLASKIDFEFVGSRSENSYEMKNPHHEGWARATLPYLREDRLDEAMDLTPDVILLYCGAEDLRTLPDAGIAVARLDKLAKTIWQKSPKCTILISQLLQDRDYEAEHKVKKFNTLLGELTENLAGSGRPIRRIKMHAKVKTESLNENGMPTESAYITMASAWFQSIEDIHRRSIEMTV